MKMTYLVLLGALILGLLVSLATMLNGAAVQRTVLQSGPSEQRGWRVVNIDVAKYNEERQRNRWNRCRRCICVSVTTAVLSSAGLLAGYLASHKD